MRVSRRSAMREMPVRARIILGPAGAAVGPVSAPESETPPAEARLRVHRIHQSGEDPFGLLLIVRRHRDVIVAFQADVHAPRHLERGQSGYKRQSARYHPRYFSHRHRAYREDSTGTRTPASLG